MNAIPDTPELVKVSEAIPQIKKILKTGGFAIINVGNEGRMLMYKSSLLGSINILPWPFSLLQPSGGCTLSYHELEEIKGCPGLMAPGKTIRSVGYSNAEQPAAIKAFLNEANEDTFVTIGPNM